MLSLTRIRVWNDLADTGSEIPSQRGEAGWKERQIDRGREATRRLREEWVGAHSWGEKRRRLRIGWSVEERVGCEQSGRREEATQGGR